MIRRVLGFKNSDATIVEPIVIPNSRDTRLVSSFCAALESLSTTPDSLSKLPNINDPTSARLIGATNPAISVSIMGNRILVVFDTVLDSDTGIRILRSSEVVKALMTGG